ncbi:MAG: RNA polymerase sigma factor [Bacteroidota bacterium]
MQPLLFRTVYIGNETSQLEYHKKHLGIVEACKRGDRKAQFELYQLYSRAMFNICLRMVKNELDAEDLLQNSFVDVFTKLHTFRSQSTIGAWIKRIVVNNCINFLKKRRLNFEMLDDRLEVKETTAASSEPQFSVEAINKAIFALPDGYRVVFSLYMIEGYDHQEIAAILGVSVATSKSQYSRAKKKLRDLLSGQMLQAT